MKIIAKVAGAALVLGLAGTAFAGGALKPLNTTNYLHSGTARVFGFPTNTVAGTNGIYLATGGPVNIADTREFGFDFQGFLLNTGAAGSIYLDFVASLNPGGSGVSAGGGRPTVTVGTNFLSNNLTVIIDNDFTDTNQLFRVVVPYVASATNAFHWATNFNMSSWPFGNSANWVGLYSISNTFGAGCFMTNVQMGINTKLIPVPLIGQ
jgi:hypothetical protein